MLFTSRLVFLRGVHPHSHQAARGFLSSPDTSNVGLVRKRDNVTDTPNQRHFRETCCTYQENEAASRSLTSADRSKGVSITRLKRVSK